MSETPALRPEFVVERHGRRFVLLAGVLDLAHTRGLEAIETELLQVPGESNGHLAIVKATVRLAGGRVFTAHGDASPQNVRKGVDLALVRMAETRALGRALRFALGVAETLAEELPPDERPVVRGTPLTRVQSRPPVGTGVRPVPGPRPGQSPRPADGRGDDLPF